LNLRLLSSQRSHTEALWLGDELPSTSVKMFYHSNQTKPVKTTTTNVISSKRVKQSYVQLAVSPQPQVT